MKHGDEKQSLLNEVRQRFHCHTVTHWYFRLLSSYSLSAGREKERSFHTCTSQQVKVFHTLLLTVSISLFTDEEAEGGEKECLESVEAGTTC